MADYQVIVNERGDDGRTTRSRTYDVPLDKQEILRPILRQKPVSDTDKPAKGIPSPPGPTAPGAYVTDWSLIDDGQWDAMD